MTLLGAPGVATRQGYLGHKNAPILKHFSISPPLFHKALFKCRPIFKVLLRFYRPNGEIFMLLTGETLLKNPLIISVALESSRGEKARRFFIRICEVMEALTSVHNYIGVFLISFLYFFSWLW